VDERNLDHDPLVTLATWYAEAQAAGAPQADAASLATATADGRPAARMVLVRRIEEHDLVVFTGRDSRKAAELAGNPHAALVFYWPELRRQVRVEGRVEELPRAEVAAYWPTRPRGSRLAAHVSRQSHPVASRAALDALYAEADAQFPDDDVPLPDSWGGYRLVPDAIEFWEHRENRLHDRVRYAREGDGWRATLLMP
jgi:pyridoxamine 5'-phosphate oxidase